MGTLARSMLALQVSLGILLAGPGFGLVKKRIELQTRQPAVVRLANTSIAFTGAPAPMYPTVMESLLATLETELISNERTLVKKKTAAEADWGLGLRITGFTIAPPQVRTDRVGKATMQYTRW